MTCLKFQTLECDYISIPLCSSSAQRSFSCKIFRNANHRYIMSQTTMLHSNVPCSLPLPQGLWGREKSALRLFVWLYYVTGSPTMFLPFLWLYHQHNLSIKDRRHGVTVKALHKQIMDKIILSSSAVTIKESSTSTLHQPLTHTYICT